MKTNSSFNISGFRTFAILVVTAAALLLNRPASAGKIIPIYTVDITENSSTSLTLIYNGTDITASAVTLTAPDHWTLTFSPSINFASSEFFWQEPGEPNLYNQVTRIRDTPANQLFVISDTAFVEGGFVPDGSTVVEPAFDGDTLVSFNITFHDLGDAPVNGVPENASTLVLLFVALAALLGASRFRVLRFA